MNTNVRLYGQLYDLSTFAHPGGNRLIKLLSTSPEPELLLEYYHTFGRIKPLLKRFKVDTGDESVNMPTNIHHTYENLRTFIRNRIGPQQLKKYREIDRWIHTLCLGLFVLVYLIILRGSWSLLCVGGFLYSFATSWYLHGNSHGIDFYGIAHIATLFSAVAVLPWEVEHVRTHHVYVNQIDRQHGDCTDPDIVLGTPFIRMSKHDPWYWWHAYQYLYFYPGVFVSGMFIVYVDLLNLIRGKFGTMSNHSIPFRRPFASEVMLQLLLKVGYLYIWIVLPSHLYPDRSIVQSIFRFSWLLMFGGIFTFFITTVSHFNSETVDEACDVHDIVLVQTNNTIDIHPGSDVMNFLTAGVNHQVVHHLFPGYPFSSYPKISLLLQEYWDILILDKNTKYRTLPTYSDAFRSQFQKLYDLSCE